MHREFMKSDGLLPVDLVHSAMDHLTAAELLFDAGPHLYDSAGYLSQLGIELLLKGWLLEVVGFFDGTHSLKDLYNTLCTEIADDLEEIDAAILGKLDNFADLRYPNRHSPVEIGDDDWEQISIEVGHICRAMPEEIVAELEKINASGQPKVTKGGRVLMQKKKEARTQSDA